MRIVGANPEMEPLYSVLTARASSTNAEVLLARLEYADVLSSPGPARIATVQLSTGQRATVVMHERKHLIEILAPLEAGLEAGIADILSDLDVLPEAVTWTHQIIDRNELFAKAESSAHAQLGGDIDVVSHYLRSTSRESRHEMVDAYASYLNAKQSELLYERLIRLMKRHRALNDIRGFEQLVAEDSIRAFSSWVDEMSSEYEREVRRYDRLSTGLSWLVISCSALACFSSLVWNPLIVLPFAAVATLVSATQVALQPARRSRRTQEFVDRFILVRNELDALSTFRDITPLNALQWLRVEKAIALIEE